MSLDKLKLTFGFLLIAMLFILAMSIALGKVEAQTSYGLLQVVTTMSLLAGGFAQWAFGNHKEKEKDKENGNEKEEGKEGKET